MPWRGEREPTGPAGEAFSCWFHFSVGELVLSPPPPRPALCVRVVLFSSSLYAGPFLVLKVTN